LIEQVAKELLNATNEWAKTHPGCGLGISDWEPLPQNQKDFLMAMARATIKAMRFPTEAMEHATDMLYQSPAYVVLRQCWTAMIDKALEE
jgi:hypothetical protein